MSSGIVSDIESRIDIVELVREYVPLKKSGANWKGLSPFKPEKTPSFVVSPAKQIAYCFATNQGGGPLRMLMMLEKIEFREALQILAKRAGVELKTDSIRDAQMDERGALTKVYTEVAHFYHKSLLSPEGLEARNYLGKRDLALETMEKWELGFSHDPREMFEAMKKKGFNEKILMDSGIFVSPFKDRFFGRVIFPIRNYRGEVIAFSGRTLRSGGDEAKYVNSPETPIFHKSSVLFGIDRAKQAITREKKVIVVEGQMDVISLHQAGFENVVGISGTAMTDAHVRMIQRLTSQIYLCLDRDSAGKLAILRSIENMTNEPVDVMIIDLGDAKDPDEFLKNGGDFKAKIQEAEPAISFLIDEGKAKHDVNTNKGKKDLLDEILSYITQIQGNVEIDQTLAKAARKLDLNLQTVYSEYNRAIRGFRRPEVSASPSTLTGSDYLVAYMTGLREGREIFLRECLFQEEFLGDPDHHVVKSYLDGTLDAELVKSYELRFETMTEGKKEDVILAGYRELVRSINQSIFRKLQKNYSNDLSKLRELIQIGKQHHLI